MTFDPTYFNVPCATLPSTQGSLWPTPMVIHQSMWIEWLFFKNLTKKSMTPRWPLTPILWSHMCDTTQGSLYPSPMKIHQSMWIQWPFFQKTWPKGHWPLHDLCPQVCWVTYVTLPKDHCVQVPWKYIKVCGKVTLFFQKFKPKVNDP